MLLEKTPYADDFPINISVNRIEEYPLHYHKDIEIIYVLKGKVKFKNGYCNYILKEGDIFTNNGHEVHCLFSESSDNVVATIKISNLFFTQYFPVLSKSCYRTYSLNDSDSKVDVLRKVILQVLLIYLQKSFNYKQQCIEAVLDLIKLLNSSFNLFAFEKKIVVNFENDNPIIIERMSRIINYIYENHAMKITLEDLSKFEHLSTFYLSHLIRECTGMSFRDFLCFARSEWSEIYLLDTNKSISTIAKDVGFSTTSYYEKHFYKWFERSPEEHRAIFKNLVKSPGRPEIIAAIPLNKAIGIVKSRLSAANSQDNSGYQVNNLKLEIKADSNAEAIISLNHQLQVSVTLDDYNVMGHTLFKRLGDLDCKKVVIRAEDTETLAEDIITLKQKLNNRGIDTSISDATLLDAVKAYGLDSIIAPIHILSSYTLSKDKYLQVRLRDQGNTSKILKGLPSLLTSSMIPKPSYYAYLTLIKARGDLISWGKNYSVIRLNVENPAFIILAYNYSKELDNFCSISSTPYEINQVINKFNDEIELNISLSIPYGKYFVSRYSLNRRNNIFHFMSKLNFPKQLNLTHNSYMEIFSLPEMDAFSELVDNYINLDFSFKGLGMQMILIQSIFEEDSYE